MKMNLQLIFFVIFKMCVLLTDGHILIIHSIAANRPYVKNNTKKCEKYEPLNSNKLQG